MMEAEKLRKRWVPAPPHITVVLGQTMERFIINTMNHLKCLKVKGPTIISELIKYLLFILHYFI